MTICKIDNCFKNSNSFIIILIVYTLIFTNLSCKDQVTQTQKDGIEIPGIPEEIKMYSMSQIIKIHQYINTDRWNYGGDIGRRNGTDYNEIAEKLNIPKSKLEKIDSYYHYDVQPILDKEIKAKFQNHKNFRPDYYHAVEATAYCGINTLMGSIVVLGQKANIDFEKESEKIAVSLIDELPGWITGYKLTFVTYEDPMLETKGDIDIGFLWVRGNNQIIKMKSSRGLYGYDQPEYNIHWHNQEWNDMKKIPYPELN